MSKGKSKDNYEIESEGINAFFGLYKDGNVYTMKDKSKNKKMKYRYYNYEILKPYLDSKNISVEIRGNHAYWEAPEKEKKTYKVLLENYDSKSDEEETVEIVEYEAPSPRYHIPEPKTARTIGATVGGIGGFVLGNIIVGPIVMLYVAIEAGDLSPGVCAWFLTSALGTGGGGYAGYKIGRKIDRKNWEREKTKYL